MAHNKETKSFEDLNLQPYITKLCHDIGLKQPTEIQQNCIPKILEGNDCIGCAKTGSGKTMTFILPIFQKLCEDPYGIFALVLTPTRELAHQIGEQFSAIGKSMNLKKCVIIGGMDMVIQAQELSKRPHVVVATPGRLADHLESCDTFSLGNVRFLVLDEADRLLGGRFDQQIQTIFKALPSKRQNLLFSATMTDTLKHVKKFVSPTVFEYIENDDTGMATVEKLEQRYVLCSNDARDASLVEVIRTFRNNINENGLIMIFTDTCKSCQLLSMTFNEVGFDNVALHSMMKQRERLNSLSKFKSNHTKILIATDVAARGLDIPLVELVVNHSIPNVPKEYIHRVGRTARAGKGGMAVSLITQHDIKLLHAIEETIGTKLTEFQIDDKEIVEIFTQISVTKREAEIKLDETDFYEKKMINKKKKLIMEGKTPEEIEEILAPKKKGIKKQKKRKNILIDIEINDKNGNENKKLKL